MNLSEFKAWFGGFTENMDGPPGEKAWRRIQARIEEIKDAPPTSYPVYIDRYWNNYPRPWWDYTSPYYGSVGMSMQAALNNVQQAPQNYQAVPNGTGSPTTITYNPTTITYNPGDAFRALGRADAETMN